MTALVAGWFSFLGQPVRVGAGLDDVAAIGEPIDDRCAEPDFGEGLGRAGFPLLRKRVLLTT
ncbi:hypothetical protein [Sphaerisporangium sp. NBC_01403]|uniref:hypothetical protein n=1 Tax=Sphaerisporangium sp. NBC_01403 TaxID=2903599 RepID=UPI0038699740